VKKILLLVSLVSIIILIAQYTWQTNEVEVNDRLITMIDSGMDLDSYSIFPPKKYAKIQGEILNKSNRQLSFVNLVYRIGNDTAIVIIEYLDAEDEVFFSTKEFEVSTVSAEYTLLEVNLSD
jgi:hypothetical protein